MKRIILITSTLLLCLAILSGCKSKQQMASSLLPSWLEEKTATLNERHSEITLWEFQGKNYYSVFVKGPERSYDMNRTTIYDADGNVHMSLGGPRKRSEKEMEFFHQAINKGIVWQSDVVERNEKSVIKKSIEMKSE